MKILNKKELGDLGEKIAEKYLQNLNYKIIGRNFRRSWGEIDIIAYDQRKKEIVFIEVKTRVKLKADDIYPEEEITKKKIQRLKKIFLSYLSSYSRYSEESCWRFDLIAIEVDPNTGNNEIRHHQDLFLEF